MLQEIRNQNDEFKKQINSKVSGLETQVVEKHIPVSLETDILKVVKYSMNDCIIKVLTAHDSPLVGIIQNVIKSYSTELNKIVSDSFKTVIDADDFKKEIVTAFSHKVARTIISNHGGLFDKVSNELNSDATFKAKATLAIATVVDDCLKGRTQ